MAKSGTGKRPKLVAVSAEMRRICVLLAEELLRWPDVRARPMFGLRAFHRSIVVFAMLPDRGHLQASIMTALQDFPDARDSLVRALRSLHDLEKSNAPIA